MDWIESFLKSFSCYEEIQKLREKRFHGSIEINFSDGVPQNYNFKQHRRADGTVKK